MIALIDCIASFFSGAEALFAILEHEDADIICLQEVSWTTREATKKLKKVEVVKSQVFLNPVSGRVYFGSDLESSRSCKWREPCFSWFRSLIFYFGLHQKTPPQYRMGLLQRHQRRSPERDLKLFPRGSWEWDVFFRQKNAVYRFGNAVKNCVWTFLFARKTHGFARINNEKLLKVS